jgi:septation ring formation regulator EzrA
MSSEETTRNLEVSTNYRTKEDLKLVLREVMESVVAETIMPQLTEMKGHIANLEIGFETRLTALGERLTGVEDRLTAIENRLVALEAGQEELRRELKLTNSKMETLNRYILDAQGRILDVTDRMDAFERSSAA